MKLYTTTQRSIEVVRETLRPGITAAEFDRAVRSVFEGAGVSNWPGENAWEWSDELIAS